MSWSGVDCVDGSVDHWGGVVSGGGVGDGGIVNWCRLVVNRLVVTNYVLGGHQTRGRVVRMASVAHCHQRTSYHDLMNKQTRLNNKLKIVNKLFVIFVLLAFFNINGFLFYYSCERV